MTSDTNLEKRIRTAEQRLFTQYDIDVEESTVELPNGSVRILSTGSGPEIVMLHGVSLAAAAWIPWLVHLKGFRLRLVELPGHGLSDPMAFRTGAVREPAVALLDDLFDALDLGSPTVVGHSLGGMFALWHAAARPGRIGQLFVIGDPAVALPGVRVKQPLSLMTTRIIGPMMLASPSPRFFYKVLLVKGLGAGSAPTLPVDLVDVLRLAARRRTNARTVAALMHAIDHFRRPRAESVMDETELRRIVAPTMFCWGVDDPYLSPQDARPSIALIEGAALREISGGHAPWLDDPEGCALALHDLMTKDPAT